MKENTNPDVLTFEEAIRMEKKLKKPDLTEDELILLILGIIDKPINGKVVMQKEVFLFYQELRDKLNISDPQFVPFKYGPYSFRIATLLDLLEEFGYLEVTNKRYKRLARYTLTEKGKKTAKEVLEKVGRLLGKDFLEKLKAMRKGLDELGHYGILRYVYQYYPEYTEKSELKDKYIHIDWGVTEA